GYSLFMERAPRVSRARRFLYEPDPAQGFAVHVQVPLMIYIGPAGVPLSCKGRTTLEGLQHVQELGLNAMEVQFVRGIRMDEVYAVEVGELAKQLGVKLGVHSPYYTNICSDDEKTIEKSMD